MLKRNEMTRKEIVAFLKLNIYDPQGNAHYEGSNDMLEHLIDEFGDPNLAYNTETGFFDYIGPELPA
jgi:hypothetical protein